MSLDPQYPYSGGNIHILTINETLGHIQEQIKLSLEGKKKKSNVKKKFRLNIYLSNFVQRNVSEMM